jgi:hypothetical protein
VSLHDPNILADAEELAAAFLAARRAKHLDFRMDAGDDDGADDQNDDDTSSADDDGDGDDQGTDALGDPGKKALDAMKAKWRTERDRARDLQRQLADATTPKNDDDGKPDLEALRKQARDEAAAAALRDRALDKIEAKAARLFSNPEDARLFLADQLDDFLDDGTVDVAAITDALQDLLEKRPYLGVTQGEPKKKFQGGADQGDRGDAGKPQLSRADVERLAREGKHAEIEKARLDGRLNKLLGIT